MGPGLRSTILAAPRSQSGTTQSLPSVGRTAETQASAAWFKDWCTRNRVSARDLAACWDIEFSLVVRKLNGAKGTSISTTDLALLPDPHFDAVFFEFRAFRQSLRSRAA